MASNPGHIACGSVVCLYEGGGTSRLTNFSLTLQSMLHFHPAGSFHQPGVFLPVSALPQQSPLNEQLKYAMDWDVTIRALKHAAPVMLRRDLAFFRVHANSRTSLQGALFLGENWIPA